MVCLDSSVLVALLRKDARAMARLGDEAAKGTRVSTTTVNLCELYRGAYAARARETELGKVEALRDTLDVLALDTEASRRYGELVNIPGVQEAPIGDFDLLIASIALTHGERVATRDVEHFQRVPGLAVEYW